ncbi:MAG: PKD domain-containing protein [Candidatus Zixiibacteriota bacterium]
MRKLVCMCFVLLITSLLSVEGWIGDGSMGFGSMSQPSNVIIYISGVWEDGGEPCAMVSRCGDVYVVEDQEWSSGDALNDINGTPNYIQGTGIGSPFYDEPILLPETAPGVYDVVLDGNLSGTYEPSYDYLIDNLTIYWGGPVPEWMDERISDLKEAAEHDQNAMHPCEQTIMYLNAFSLMMTSHSFFANLVAGNFVGAVSDGASLAGYSTDYNSAVLSIGKDLLQSVADAAKQTAAGIAADPPDLVNYPYVYMPYEHASEEPPVDDTHVLAIYHARNWTAINDNFRRANLASLERYQGARDEGEIKYARIQAKMLAHFSEVLKVVLDSTANSYDRLGYVWDSIGVAPAMAPDSQNVRMIQDRLSTTGYSTDELLEFRKLGCSDEQLDSLKEQILDANTSQFIGKTGSEMWTDAADTMRQWHTALDTVIYFANEMVDSLTDGEYGIQDLEPVAEINGPYRGQAGTAINFSATGSDAGGGSSFDYGWDFDADGDFTDATTENPSYTYYTPGIYMVGLKIENDLGKAMYEFSYVVVEIANYGPYFTSTTPDTSFVYIETSGGTETIDFAVTADDPESDALTYSWDVDGSMVGSGTEYSFSSSDTGLFIVTCTVEDAPSNNCDNKYTWSVHIVEADIAIDFNLTSTEILFTADDREQVIVSADSQDIMITNTGDVPIDLSLRVDSIVGFTLIDSIYDHDDTLEYHYGWFSLQAIFNDETTAPDTSDFGPEDFITETINYASSDTFGTGGIKIPNTGDMTEMIWFMLRTPEFYPEDTFDIKVIIQAREDLP